MIMRWIVISCLVLILAGVLCIPVAGAQPLPPNYDKILQIHLDYQDNAYSVSFVEVRYGEAPNLDILSGPLEGTILDSNGNVLKSFSFQDPGTTYGIIAGIPGESTPLGYTEPSSSGEMIVTLPYLQGMQTFTLSDSRTGSMLASADLGPQITAFCADYSEDPDCLALSAASAAAVPSRSAQPAADSTSLLFAALFSAAVLVAAAMAIRTLRQRMKKVVLIVDDDPEITNIVDIFLRTKGYVTLTAASGVACLEILKKQVPHVILLDVFMTPMDGWQTLGKIKKNPALMRIPVMMLTASPISPDKAKQYGICIADYITKPFQLEHLAAAIDSVIRQREMVRETFALARKAGIEREKFCELATLTRRISVDKKILGMLEVPKVPVAQASMDTLNNMLVVDYIHVKTNMNETRARQLRNEINTALKKKGLPEVDW
jgi:DNA-binding response OmpR family regulator